MKTLTFSFKENGAIDAQNLQSVTIDEIRHLIELLEEEYEQRLKNWAA